LSTRFTYLVKPSSLFAVFLFLWQPQEVTALPLDETNVLLLYNADEGTLGDGFQIATHYALVHPGVNMVGLTGINSILSGSYNEEVSAADYLSVIRPQVLNAIAGTSNEIDVIVTTKGLPLQIDAGSQPTGNTSLNWKRWSSLESELTRIDSIDSIDEMGDQFILTGLPQFDTNLASNPYYNTGGPFIRAGSDPVNGDIRLTARLDGYSVSSVNAAIDRAQKVFIVPFGQYVVADDDPTAGVDQMVDDITGGPGPGLVNVLGSASQAFLYENTDTAITTAPGPVIGYVSHGTNDGAGGLAGDYIANQLQFELADGAVFLTHESFNALSFDASHSQTQGLIGDWLEIGGTAGLGHVQEPYNGSDNVTNEDLFYQMLLPPNGAQPGDSGLTFVEAAWNATRQLSYVNTVVGDPLMRFQAWLPGDANLDGSVNLDDLALLQVNWLSPGSFREGDFNGDGNINLDDLAILQINWLQSVNSGGTLSSTASTPTLDLDTGIPTSAVSVPEPSTGTQVMLALCLSLLLIRENRLLNRRKFL